MRAHQTLLAYTSTNCLQQKKEREKNPQLRTDQVQQKLAEATLGLALMHVGGTKNDMSMGPELMKQVYNSRLINSQTMTRIDNYDKSAGLMNHYAAYAISVGVKKEHIKGGLQGHKNSAYSNFVQWSDAARTPGAQMVLFNGNHRVMHIANKYQQEFHNYFTGLEALKGAKEPIDKTTTEAQVKKAKTVLMHEAVWLVTFVDLGKHIFWSAYVCANSDHTDVIMKATNSTLLLHELSKNAMLPCKDDTDTEKLKNALRVRRNRTNSTPAHDTFLIDVVAEWVRTRNSTNVRTAWVVKNFPVFHFLEDLYACETFENSKMITVSLLYANWGVKLAGVSLLLH